MAFISSGKRGEKRGISTLMSETDSDVSNTSIGDSSSSSHNDDSSFCADESVQETQEDTTTASSGSLSTRSGRRQAKKQRYLEGKSRKPYRVSRELERSLEESDTAHDPSLSSSISMASHTESSQWNKNVCKSCAPVLQKYVVTFKGMKRQGTELKKRKRVNPHPKNQNPSSTEI